MRLPESALRAATDLRARPGRSLMSGLGIAIGVAAVVAVLGVAQTNTQGLLNRLYALQDVLTVTSLGLTGGSSAMPLYSLATVGRLAPVEAVAGVTQLSWTVTRNPLVPSQDTSGIAVLAVEGSIGRATGTELLIGHQLGPSERLPVAVLGYQAARLLGVDRQVLPCRVWMNHRWVVVIGVLRPAPLADVIDYSALVGYPFAQAANAPVAGLGTMFVKARPGTAQAVSDILPATVEPLTPVDVSVGQANSAVAAEIAARNSLAGLFLALVGVGLLVAGLGVANTLTVAVVEQRPEIGLARALGATRADISLQFLAGGVLLALAGAGGGVVLGTLAVVGYAWLAGLPAVFPLEGLGVGIGVALLVGVLASFYPAAKAARLPPSDVLRMVP